MAGLDVVQELVQSTLASCGGSFTADAPSDDWRVPVLEAAESLRHRRLRARKGHDVVAMISDSDFRMRPEQRRCRW